METVETFKYLGRVVEKSDDVCLVLRANLSKARIFWWCFGNILDREWEYGKISGFFY